MRKRLDRGELVKETENKTYGNKHRELEELTTRRLEKLRYMFRDFNIDVTGTPECPVLILDDNKLLFTYVNNFNLSFLESYPEKGSRPQTLKTFRITFNTVITDEDFEMFMKHNNKRVYTVQLVNSAQFLVGYENHYKIDNEKKKFTPIFGTAGRKYYLQESKAQNISDSLNRLHGSNTILN